MVRALESPEPLEINSIQKQQHWEYQLFLSSLIACKITCKKGWLLLYESGNIPFLRKLGAFKGFIRSYQPLFCKAFFLMTFREGWVKLAKRADGWKSWNLTAPPMTWSERYTRDVGWQNDTISSKPKTGRKRETWQSMTMHLKMLWIMSLEHDATCPFPDHSQWTALSTRREIYVSKKHGFFRE